MTYADSSFLLRLVSREAGSEGAAAAFRRLGRPRLAYTGLHDLEMRNGLRLKAFLEKKSLPPSKRASIDRECAQWQARLDRLLNQGIFAAVPVKWEAAAARALALSLQHTGRIGARAYDILHGGFALELHTSAFITADARQALLAKAAGLKTTLVAGLT